MNPKKALRSVLPRAIDVGEGYAVRPITLGMYALLERINSPLLTNAAQKGGTLELLPSLFVLTHEPMEALEGDLLAKSVAWADSVSAGIVERIRDAAFKQIQALTDVLPESGKQKKKTATAI